MQLSQLQIFVTILSLNHFSKGSRQKRFHYSETYSRANLNEIGKEHMIQNLLRDIPSNHINIEGLSNWGYLKNPNITQMAL